MVHMYYMLEAMRTYEIFNVHARYAYTHARIFAFRHVTIITAEIYVSFFL